MLHDSNEKDQIETDLRGSRGSIKMQTHANRGVGALCQWGALNIFFSNLVASPYATCNNYQIFR